MKPRNNVHNSYEYDEGKYSCFKCSLKKKKKSCFKCHIITQSLLFSYIQHLKIPRLVSSPISTVEVQHLKIYSITLFSSLYLLFRSYLVLMFWAKSIWSEETVSNEDGSKKFYNFLLFPSKIICRFKKNCPKLYALYDTNEQFFTR